MLTLFLFTNKKRQKNETIIGLDSVGNVDTVKRNGYTYSEVLSLNSDKIYYLPDISIKRNDNEKEVYINNYKTNSLSNCNIYKRKYGRIILNEDNTSNTKLKELVVNKKTQKDQMKYISSLTDSSDIDYLNNGDTYSVFTKHDIEKKVNPRILETNTFIGIGTLNDDPSNIGLKTSYEYDSIGRIKRKNIRTNIVGDAINDDVKVSKEIIYIPNTSLVENEKYYINRVSEEPPCINITYDINGTLDSYTITDKDNNQQTYTYLYDKKISYLKK